MKPEELLISASHFWLESSKDILKKEFTELNQLVSKHLKKYVKSDKEVLVILTNLYKRFEDITNGEDVEANAYILSVGSLQLLLEIDYFKGSDKMKANRLQRDIYSTIEANLQLADEFRNANKLISKLGNSYE